MQHKKIDVATHSITKQVTTIAEIITVWFIIVGFVTITDLLHFFESSMIVNDKFLILSFINNSSLHST